MAAPGFCKYRNHETGIWLDCVTVLFFKGKLDRLTIYWRNIRPVLRIYLECDIIYHINIKQSFKK